ncbi:uncharacterized protein LOC142985548 [Anticarsia gemmatalis]|uniref:uncharacterized protein LOC142985548 n=1 Tax=Anticarsia gemmatalis TaxID=129554 RepID=UPI003F75C86B
MSEATDTTVDAPDPEKLICRGCLKEWGPMKNMFHWGLDEDFFRYTDIPRAQSEGLSELICATCEADLMTTKQFKDRCQQSDKVLKLKIVKQSNPVKTEVQCKVTPIFESDQLLILNVTAPDPDDKILLPCPYGCNEKSANKNHLYYHLCKVHNTNKNLTLDIRYYCTFADCVYSVEYLKKYFSGRKFLNQHYNRIHKEKQFNCESCNAQFAMTTDYERHLKSCNLVFMCSICHVSYATNESYLVHLKRKHPDLHKQYKLEKKAKKRRVCNTENVKRKRKKSKSDMATLAVKDKEDVATPVVKETESVATQEIKEGSLATPTDEDDSQPLATLKSTNIPSWQLQENFEIEIPIEFSEPEIDVEIKSEEEETIVDGIIDDEPEVYHSELTNTFKNSSTQIPEDLSETSLPWNKNYFEIQTDDMSTQTVFEDLLSIKSQQSEDEIFFSESVSLSDIQTQTLPFDFALNRCNKETQSCIPVSPDLSIKETQTCLCLSESTKQNFRLFDSLSSSPGSSNLTSTETQTHDPRMSVKSDVLLSFSSAQTQTCFDSSDDAM